MNGLNVGVMSRAKFSAGLVNVSDLANALPTFVVSIGNNITALLTDDQ